MGEVWFATQMPPPPSKPRTMDPFSSTLAPMSKRWKDLRQVSKGVLHTQIIIQPNQF